jgi:hypothetical protein
MPNYPLSYFIRAFYHSYIHQKIKEYWVFESGLLLDIELGCSLFATVDDQVNFYQLTISYPVNVS